MSTVTTKTPRTFTLASRGSDLAKVQTHAVRDTLQAKYPSTTFSTSFITTDGDRNLSQALYLIGGKSLWTKDLEVALLEGAVDLLVHCYKDVPTTLPDGCEIAGVLEREDPVDALIVKKGLEYKTLEELPEGSVVGTSSVRRVAQLKRRFPKLAFRDVRGNIDTRISKLDAPDSPFTAIVLAKAGLVRLGLDSRISSDIPPPTLYYAVSQAALAIEIRSDDEETRQFCRALTHWQTEWRCAAERACLRVLEGGCSVPVGTHTEIVENGPAGAVVLRITGCVTSLTGAEHVQHTLEEQVKSVEEAEAVGAKLARILVDTGAKAILDDLTQDRDKRIGDAKTLEEQRRVEAAFAA